MSTFIVMGSSSDIALACLPLFRQHGYELVLLSRHPAAPELLQHLGASSWYYFDVAAPLAHHEELWQKIVAQHPDIQGLFCCVGFLGQQEEVKASLTLQQQSCIANFTGLLPFLELAKRHFVQQKSGHIVAVSSVAGERGRASNYPYGSAKAGFTAYLSGLRQELWHSGVHVLTVKPGLVQTKMITGRHVPAFLCASPEKVARDIMKALRRRQSVLYTPLYWSVIMFMVRAIPEWLYRRCHF